MPNIPSLEQNCETDGIMSTLAGIAGSIQANEVIKSILNIGKPLRNEIMIFNSLDLSFRKVKLNKNSSCKNHLHVLVNKIVFLYNCINRIQQVLQTKGIILR